MSPFGLFPTPLSEWYWSSSYANSMASSLIYYDEVYHGGFLRSGPCSLPLATSAHWITCTLLGQQHRLYCKLHVIIVSWLCVCNPTMFKFSISYELVCALGGAAGSCRMRMMHSYWMQPHEQCPKFCFGNGCCNEFKKDAYGKDGPLGSDSYEACCRLHPIWVFFLLSEITLNASRVIPWCFYLLLVVDLKQRSNKAKIKSVPAVPVLSSHCAKLSNLFLNAVVIQLWCMTGSHNILV